MFRCYNCGKELKEVKVSFRGKPICRLCEFDLACELDIIRTSPPPNILRPVEDDNEETCEEES